MWRQSWLGLVGALIAALTPSCLGGQTGQPDSLDCSAMSKGADAEWRGSTVGQLGQAFAGAHTGALRWVEEPPGSAQSTPIAFDDSVTIDIRYLGGSAMVNQCGGDLDMPVTVEVTTATSALSDRGAGTLSFAGTTRPLRATLTFDGAALSVNATLMETTAAQAPQGSLEPHADDTPGGSAHFP